MAKGTKFGTLHSSRGLHLIQQKVDVQPAAPKTTYINIPGGNGSRDLTEALGVGVKYSDRKITWTFALRPGDDWSAKQQEVSTALNGLACHITLDDDPAYYYDGRLTVSSYKTNKLLRQITVTAICRPYKLKHNMTIVRRNDLNENYTQIILQNSGMPVVPIISCEQEILVRFAGEAHTLGPGTHMLLAIRLVEPRSMIEIKSTSGSGSVTISFREGAL